MKTPSGHVPQVTNVGQNLLAGHCKVVGQSKMAQRLGVSRQRVNEWLNGRKTPDAAARGVMFESLGVPIASWDQPLHQAPAEARRVDELTPRTGLVKSDSGEIIEQSSGRAQLTDLLIDVQMKRRSAEGPDRVRFMTLEGQLLKQLIASEGDEFERLSQIYSSPMFLDFVGRTLDALAPWPDAVAAVEKVWGLE